MAASTIQITFTEDLILGAQLGFDVNFYNPILPSSRTFIYNWVNVRGAAYQVTTGTPTINPGERAAINFAQALSLDVGSLFTITRDVNIVIISSEVFGEYYAEFLVNGALAPYENDPSLEFDINNYSGTPFVINNLEYQESTLNKCTETTVSVETSILIENIIEPVQVTSNTLNPVQFNVLRGQNYTLKIQDYNGNIITENRTSAPILNASNFTINIINSPFGATVNITNVNSDGLDLEYSLDNTTWQSSNIFSGLIVDQYTLYIRDNLGCSTSKTFEIDEYDVNFPYFKISKSNSIRFVNRIDFGDSSNYKNDENTMSCEAFAFDKELAYKEIQLFNSGDIITTQFKSNYKDISVHVVKSDNTEITIPIVKKSTNIGNKDKRDCRIYDLGSGKTGIYFVSGNLYDFDTESITGTYALNGGKPYYASFGNYVILDGAWFLIEEIIYDETKNAEVIVINNIHSGPEENKIVGCIFNYFDFEVYEFTIDMGDYLNQRFRVRINNNSTNFDDLVHLSELIQVKVKNVDTLEIKYYNNENTDVFYATGIQHKIRMPYERIEISDEVESEILRSDTDTTLLSNEIYEGDEFEFSPTTKEMARKLVIALTHKNVFIDDVGYAIADKPNVEVLENSNLHTVKVKMIKTGVSYNSTGQGDELYNGESLEVPGLIEIDNSFLIY